ncbi:amidohydrolase family protein [Haloarchaeobius sp. TZWSO28]|uniref:amidohydrolase family protein n=1 Tax=Haloarchaeobius sp. TZWSO28 TaxID=3446119 RepID=UPI003EBDBA0E
MRTKDELAALAADWTVTPAERETFEASLGDATLYDSHSHIFPVDPYWGPGQTDLDAFIDELDRHGVDRAILLSEEQMEKGFKVPSWWILEQAERYPDRLIPFCAVEPRMAPDRETMAKMVDEYVAAGARGFGELKVGLAIDDERMRAIYEICDERDLPLLIHMSDKHAVDEPGLPGLERMLQAYPDLDFILHAHGWWAHISAAVTTEDMAWYAEGPVEPGGRCDELLETYDNCYADFSPSGFNALARDLEYAQSFLERHHESLLFGTDASYLPEKTIPHFAFFDRFELPADAWENIRFRNLVSILR